MNLRRARKLVLGFTIKKKLCYLRKEDSGSKVLVVKEGYGPSAGDQFCFLSLQVHETWQITKDISASGHKSKNTFALNNHV